MTVQPPTHELPTHEELPRESTSRSVIAVLFALLAPVLCVLLLAFAAGRAYDRVDAGGPAIFATLLLLSALLLPCAQAVAIFLITRSWVARVVGSLTALVCVPVYLGLLLILSWTHH